MEDYLLSLHDVALLQFNDLAHLPQSLHIELLLVAHDDDGTRTRLDVGTVEVDGILQLHAFQACQQVAVGVVVVAQQPVVGDIGWHLPERRIVVVDAVDDGLLCGLEVALPDGHVVDERVHEQQRLHGLVGLRSDAGDVAAATFGLCLPVGGKRQTIGVIGEGAKFPDVLEQYRLHASAEIVAPQRQSRAIVDGR